MMRIRSLIFAPVAVLSVLAGGLLFASAPALARTETGPFGTFANPESIAIEQATGDVYVYDRSAGDLYKFNANMVPEDFTFTGSNKIAVGPGGPSGQSQVAVDNSNGPAKGDIYIATDSEVKVYNSAGEELTPLSDESEEGSPGGVAVDSSGAVYVSFAEFSIINKYIPVANPVTKADYSCTLDVGGFNLNLSVAVDSAGIYTAAASGGGEGKVTKYKASQCNAEKIKQNGEVVDVAGSTSTLAIDPENEDLYINTESNVVVFNSSNTKIDEFGSGSLSGSYGIGVSDASGHEGDVYVPAREEPNEQEKEEIEEGVEGVGPGILVFAPASAPTEFPLKVEKEGTGAAEGKVTSTPPGITCGTGAGCEAKFKEGETVTLTATEEGATFTKWTGCKAEPTPTTCEVEMTEAKTVKAEYAAVSSTKFPLNVYITGDGEVKGAMIACTPLGGVCEEEAVGPTTLTATPTLGSGYVLAGWIGCKKTVGNTCEVDVSAAREVTAVFLKEGTAGAPGAPGTPGTNGTNGAPGTNGTNGSPGAQGPAGAQGEPGAAGANGSSGEKGANGSNGAAGAQGSAGPAGPAGPAGKEGPAGKVQVVMCTKSGKKKKCTTKTVSGTVKFTTSSARATLSRHGVVYAAGAARATKRGMSLRLLSLRKLKPGKYTLTLISGSGKHETTQTEVFTLS